MSAVANEVKEKIDEAIDSLPSAGQIELINFLDYLQYKYSKSQAGKPVKLGGLWADLGFDARTEDVRALRQQITAELLKEFEQLYE